MSTAAIAKRRTTERLRLVADQFYGAPWAIKLAKLQEIHDALQLRLQGRDLDQIRAEYGDGEARKPRFQISDGVAVIEMVGTLSKRANLLTYMSGGTSYEILGNCCREALADDRVKAILIRSHSPGGAASGPAELSDLLYHSRSRKPIWMICDGMAASAAYYVGSGAERIVINADGEAGSIGTYFVHYDRTEQNKQIGLKPTFIRAGKYKAAGHPDKPLDATDRQSLQTWVNYYNGLFLEAVARNRDLSLADTDDWAEGREFVGQQAIDAGLADSIGTFHDTMVELRDRAKNPASIVVPDTTPAAPPAEPDTEPEETKMNADSQAKGQSDTTPTATPPPTPVILSTEQLRELLQIKTVELTEQRKDVPAPKPENTAEAERTRCKEIHALGVRFKDDKLAAQLIDSGASLDAAKAAFFDRLCQTQPPAGESADDLTAGPEAKLRADYERNRKIHEVCGVSLEDFVAVNK